MVDQSEPPSLAMSERQPLCIDDIPPEIISGILLNAIDSYGDDIYNKWRFPLLFRRVSKRFYRITTDTRPLWKYLYIHRPLHNYLHHHISQSGALSLIANVGYSGMPAKHGDNGDNSGGESDEEGGKYRGEDGFWKDMMNVLIPILPRLASLTFHSPWDNAPVIELFRHKMPALSSLDVEGACEGWPGCSFLSSHLPALRKLQLVSIFLDDIDLSGTLEELYFGTEGDIQSPSATSFWNALPPTLRVLRVENITLDGIVASFDSKILLPCLKELYFREYCTGQQVSVLRTLDAPSLQTLGVHVDWNFEERLDGPVPFLDFPALTRLTWHSPGPVLLDSLVRLCDSLECVCIKIPTRFTAVADFVASLAKDPNLLPRLEDLAASGASMNGLKRLISARPQLKRLKVFWMELGLGGPTWAGDYADWQECTPWLASRNKLYYSDVTPYCWEARMPIAR